MTNVTPQQLRDLWLDPDHAGIDRGDSSSPITRDILASLVLRGGVHVDDNGDPLESEWDTLARELNSDPSGAEQPTSKSQEIILQKVAQARVWKEEADAAAEKAGADYREAIREAFALRAPGARIGEAAGTTLARARQIRDGGR